MTEQNNNWPIVVLSLEGEDARRAPLLDSLDALALPYEVFMGVDGRNGLSLHWQTQIDRVSAQKRVGRPMTDGEFACALSHREIYRRILSEGWEGAVVLEDDAIVGPQFAIFMKRELYKIANFLMLDHSHARVRGKATEVLPGVQMYRLALSPSLATAYSLGRLTAENLTTANTPVRDVADWPCDVSSLSAAVVVPQIVGHPDPDCGVSHLRQDRHDAAHAQKRLGGSKHMHIFKIAFWRRWILKRLSRRVS